MDLNVRFWNPDTKLVESRFYHSEFLGHTTANDLMLHFDKGLSSLDRKVMCQISMDGPNVNKSFYRKVTAKRDELGLPGLINIGSCNLHNVHGCFKTGALATDWHLKQIMKASRSLVKDSPARKDDYITLNNANLFPLNFTGVRWIEDKQVADRLIKVWDNVKTTVDYYKSNKTKTPQYKTYPFLVEAVQDQFTVSKLHVFSHIASKYKPFLTSYQSDAPLVPYMHNHLVDLIKDLMAMFVKPALVSGVTTLNNFREINFESKEGFLKKSKIDIGYAAKDLILSLSKRTKAEDIEKFRSGCQTFFTAMLQKFQGCFQNKHSNDCYCKK